MKLLIATLALFVGTLGWASTSVMAASDTRNPAGNNGVIKINDEVAPDNIPNNHPHVGCTFSIEFYNYDKGDYNATVAFELQSPTIDGRTLTVASGNLKPFIGGDNAGGGTDLDASETYRLRFAGEPHTQQGYHVKITVRAPGSKGSDKKHKVFWVQPCAEQSTPSNTPNTLGTSTNIPSALPVTGSSLAPIALVGAATTGAAYLAHFTLSSRKRR